MKVINFLNIYYALSEFFPFIQFSYLTKQEIIKNLNFPIKDIHLSKDEKDVKDEILNLSDKAICLIIAEQQSYKSSLNAFDKLNNIEGIKIKKINFLNKKLSAVMAGLGQYGKNQLIYHQDFGFEVRFQMYIVYNDVINLPIRNIPNYNILSLCKNCNLCSMNCPAKAIHIEENGPHWLDINACRSFYVYGEHNTIPSIKYGINHFLDNKYSQEELLKVVDRNSFKQLFGFDDKEIAVERDGKTYLLDIDFCKECMNQPPCRKKIYTYDKNKLRFYEKI